MATSTTTTVAETVSTSLNAESLVHDLRKVYRSGVTRDLTWREEQLKQLSKMVRDNDQAFYDAVYADLGRGPFDTFAEVVMVAKGALDLAKNVRKWARPQKVATDSLNLPGKSEIVSDPYGVVLILAPWNFPFTTAFEPLMGAIVAGNCVVLKPSELAPACSALMKRLIGQYLDSTAVKVVEGGPEVAIALMEQKWDKIFFTGGTEIGRKVAVAAAKHLTPVTLELGGKNPCYVDASADLEVACRRIVYGAFVNAGQICLKPEYILVEESIAGKLVEQVKKTVEQFYGPDPTSSPDMAHIISDRHLSRLISLLEDPRVKEKIILGGTWDREKKFLAPTFLRDVPWDTPLMEQETFGPIVAIQTVSSVEEAIAIINDRPKPLALYVFTAQDPVFQKFAAETSSGGLCMNEVVMHICNSNLPFGGVGDSGMGAYHGKYSFECFSHRKAVLKKGPSTDVSIRYPPGTTYKLNIMKALLDFDIISLIKIFLGWKK